VAELANWEIGGVLMLHQALVRKAAVMALQQIILSQGEILEADVTVLVAAGADALLSVRRQATLTAGKLMSFRPMDARVVRCWLHTILPLASDVEVALQVRREAILPIPTCVSNLARLMRSLCPALGHATGCTLLMGCGPFHLSPSILPTLAWHRSAAWRCSRISCCPRSRHA
jgi:hypothetical protein